MAKIDSSIGYSVKVIDGQTHIYCLQRDGTAVDTVLKPGNNTLRYYYTNDNGALQSGAITLKWTDIRPNSTFLAVGNPNTGFSVQNLSKIENTGNDMVYGYVHSGGAQTGPGGFNRLIHLFEDIAEANGMQNPTIATSGYSGSGSAAYITARDSSSVNLCILADPWSDLYNYNSGDNTYTLVLTSNNGHDAKRIMNSNTKNTFIIELNRPMTSIHGKMYDLVRNYNLTRIMTGDLNIDDVLSRIEADGYEANLIFIDENGNINEHLDNTTAQGILEGMMREAGSTSLEKIVEASENLRDLSSFYKVNDGTLASNLAFVSNAVDQIQSGITDYSNITYTKASDNEAGVVEAMYAATNYYGNVTNILYNNLSAEADAIYGIANAIYKLDGCAALVAETTLTDGISGLFSTNNSSVSTALDTLNSKSAELLSTAQSAVLAGGRYDELKSILGNTAVSGSVGRISVDSLESAIKSIVPSLDAEVTKANNLSTSVNSLMTGIGSSNILQGEVWNNVKTNLTNYDNLLRANAKASTFISDTIKTAMGLIANYINGSSEAINAVAGTDFSGLVTVGELDDSKLSEIQTTLTDIATQIDTLRATITEMENATEQSCSTPVGTEPPYCTTVPKYSASDIKPYKDSLTKYETAQTALNAYASRLEGFAPIVQQAQSIINDAIEQVKTSYENPVVDTQGNQTFNDNFSLDLSAYGIDDSIDYKALIDNYYENTQEPNNNTEPEDENPDNNPNKWNQNPSNQDSGSPDTTQENTEVHTEIETEIQTEPHTEVHTEIHTEVVTEVKTETITEAITEAPSLDEIIDTPDKPNHNGGTIVNLSSNSEVDNIVEVPTEPIIVIEEEPPVNEYLENIVVRPKEQPKVVNTQNVVQDNNKDNVVKTMGIASGIGVALGAVSLGAHSIIKNKDEDKDEEDFGYNR